MRDGSGLGAPLEAGQDAAPAPVAVAEDTWSIDWKEAVAGAISGAMTVLLLHPLDVVKTRLQVQERGTALYRGAAHAVTTITRREGVAGLYAGLSPSLIGGALSWGLYWIAWKSIHSYHRAASGAQELPWHTKLLVGAQAGVLVSAATNPLWVVKTRMQLVNTNKVVKRYQSRAGRRTSGLASAVRQVYRRDGVRGFYRGLGPALLLCSHGAVQMMIYEEMKERRHSYLAQRGLRPSPVSDAVLLGAGAKLVASACTYPLQVARSRMQQQLYGGKVLAYSSLPRALATVVRTSGARGLYQGFTANILRVCPQAGIQFFIYEQARKLLA